jgi:signal transduction histidine kinase
MAEMGGDVSYTSDVALTSVCRAAEVRRALRNLIDNALRYGVRARVSAESIDGMAAIHVDDDGPGIPEEEIERVFEPFARLEVSRNADTGGYGLGLAIARLVARGHGGDVILKNRAVGLRATLRLPLA